jgi:hypothetical protein
LEPVPADYERLLACVASTYPMPARSAEAVTGVVTGVFHGWRRLGSPAPQRTRPVVAAQAGGN